jgi:signal transduction histidine kinase
VERARDLLGGKPVTLKVVEDAQFALHAPLRVFSVLLSNLLRNACAYTEQGSVTVTIGADYVRVADTGVGIAAEDLKSIFQPYFRGKQSGKSGHGIGLTIVKRLSERFGWPVDLQSTEGVGTTVTVRFPNPQPV